MDERLSRRLQSVIRHGRWIIAGTVLCMLVTFIISHLLPKIYAATTYILVVEPRVNATYPIAWDYTLIPTFVPLVDNDAIIAQILQHFYLDRAPFHLTLHRFRQKGYLDVRLPKSSRLIEIDIQFPDARLAADIANYLAQCVAEANDQSNVLETAATQKIFKERLDRAAARLSETETSRIALQKRAQIESREAQLEILLDEKAQVSKQIGSLQLSLLQDDSALKFPGQSLGTEPRTLQLKNGVTSDRLRDRSTKKLDVNDPEVLSETDQVVDATNEGSRRKLADSAVRVAGERRTIEAARSRLPQIDRQINDLLSGTSELRSEIERSDQDFQLASEAYESASHDYRDASVTVAARSVVLRQVSPALVPEQPVGLGAWISAVLAGVLGLALLSGAVAALESLREIRSEPLDPTIKKACASEGTRNL